MGEKMTLREVLDGVLVHVDGIAPYAEVPVVDLQAWADTLTAHLTQPAQAVDVGAVREVLAEMERYLGDVPGWRSTIDKLTRDLGNAQAEGWLPIETAPAGVSVIVACGSSVGEALLHETGEWWWANNHPTDSWGMQIYPDHWQPLPTPPQPEE